MNPKAYSPARGCLIIATSLKACEVWSEANFSDCQNQDNWMEIRTIVKVFNALTWWNRSTNLLWGCVNIANKWHFLDKPFTNSKNRSSQPRWHENTNKKDQRDGGNKPKPCRKFYWKSTAEILLNIVHCDLLEQT